MPNFYNMDRAVGRYFALRAQESLSIDERVVAFGKEIDAYNRQASRPADAPRAIVDIAGLACGFSGLVPPVDPLAMPPER